MYVQVLEEAGYESAMLGISLSWASNPDRAKIIAPGLAHKPGGHNKFLESIMIWMAVVAPRYWWQEADTYRLSSKQSGSTMHTITKNPLTQENFQEPIWPMTLIRLNALIDLYKAESSPFVKKQLFLKIKNELPEGFLQRRVWCVSYKTLQNIYHQRINHKLPLWRNFLEATVSQLAHPEFIRPNQFTDDDDNL